MKSSEEQEELSRQREEMFQKMSEETGLPVDVIKESKEFNIASTLADMIRKSEVALTYMGPDKYAECLSTGILVSLFKDEMYSAEQKEQKTTEIKELVKFAVNRYYDVVIMHEIKRFLETVGEVTKE